MAIDETERLRRWRLALGSDAAGGTGVDLQGADASIDGVLEELYGERSADLGGSSPRIARWLGDIRTYFPTSAVRVMQQDALQRLNLTQMLMQPELLETVEADVHLVATLLSLNRVMPAKTKETARQVVRKVVEELERKLANPLMQAVRGSLNRATRSSRVAQDRRAWISPVRALTGRCGARARATIATISQHNNMTGIL